MNVLVILLFLLVLPFWVRLAKGDPSTEAILRQGWSPIIFSMLISSSGGFVLETAMRRFPQMALFQPVINGERPFVRHSAILRHPDNRCLLSLDVI